MDTCTCRRSGFGCRRCRWLSGFGVHVNVSAHTHQDRARKRKRALFFFFACVTGEADTWLIDTCVLRESDVGYARMQVGWKHWDTVKELEAKRKVKSEAYWAKKKDLIKVCAMRACLCKWRAQAHTSSCVYVRGWEGNMCIIVCVSLPESDR